jgi:hypothetical protein
VSPSGNVNLRLFVIPCTRKFGIIHMYNNEQRGGGVGGVIALPCSTVLKK